MMVLLLLLLIGIWCGSTMAQPGRPWSIASGGGDQRRVIELLLTVMTPRQYPVPVVLRDGTVACRRGGGGVRAGRADLVDGLTEAAGAGDHLPAAHRQR